METVVPKEKTIRTLSMKSSQIVLLFLFWGSNLQKQGESGAPSPKGKNNKKMEPGVPKKEKHQEYENGSRPKRKINKKMKPGVSKEENNKKMKPGVPNTEKH